MDSLMLIAVGLVAGLLLAGLGLLALRRLGKKAPIERAQTQTIFERVSAVGRLVGLEVYAKEIATSRKGWGWLPPILLSQARLAMIFHFEKQYSIDLGLLSPADVEEMGPGRFRLRLPKIEGALRLTEVTPYDIQAGRVLGLLDIIQVDAPTQHELMKNAQSQAASLYEANDRKYGAEARKSIERQLRALLSLFEVELEFVWGDEVAGGGNGGGVERGGARAGAQGMRDAGVAGAVDGRR